MINTPTSFMMSIELSFTLADIIAVLSCCFHAISYHISCWKYKVFIDRKSIKHEEAS